MPARKLRSNRGDYVSSKYEEKLKELVDKTKQISKAAQSAAQEVKRSEAAEEQQKR